MLLLLALRLRVSIPDRVLGIFRLLSIEVHKPYLLVSIPDRVLGIFRRAPMFGGKVREILVSIPDRVLGIFRLHHITGQVVT